jgi:hypothetical protein
MKLADFDRQAYVGEFTAPIAGSLVLSVNDAVFLWGDDTFFYTGESGKNRGRAAVTVELCIRAGETIKVGSGTSGDVAEPAPVACPEDGVR